MSERKSKSKEPREVLDDLRRLGNQLVRGPYSERTLRKTDELLWTACENGLLGEDDLVIAVMERQRADHCYLIDSASCEEPLPHGFTEHMVQRWCSVRIPGCPINPLGMVPDDELSAYFGKMVCAIANVAAGKRRPQRRRNRELNDVQRDALSVIQHEGGMTGQMIASRLGRKDVAQVRRDVLKPLREKGLIVNESRNGSKGYYVVAPPAKK